MHHPTDRTAHTTTFVIPVVVHWLEREMAQWIHHEGLIRRAISSFFSFFKSPVDRNVNKKCVEDIVK